MKREAKAGNRQCATGSSQAGGLFLRVPQRRDSPGGDEVADKYEYSQHELARVTGRFAADTMMSQAVPHWKSSASGLADGIIATRPDSGGRRYSPVETDVRESE